MSDETKTIKVTATPETLAEMAVKAGPDGVVLEWPNGLLCATIGRDGVTLWRKDESALEAMRRWVAEQIRAGYEAGHAAGLSDLSKITAPVGTPLEEVADLRREVERLTRERDTASDKARAGAMLDVAAWLDLPALPEGAAALETRVRNAIAARCAEGSKADAAAYERGRRQGWVEARRVARAVCDDKLRERGKAAEALAEAEKAAEVAGYEYHAASDVVDAIREAEPKVTA